MTAVLLLQEHYLWALSRPKESMDSVGGSDAGETPSHKKTDSKDKAGSSEGQPSRYDTFRCVHLRMHPLHWLLPLLQVLLLPSMEYPQHCGEVSSRSIVKLHNVTYSARSIVALPGRLPAFSRHSVDIASRTVVVTGCLCCDVGSNGSCEWLSRTSTMPSIWDIV